MVVNPEKGGGTSSSQASFVGAGLYKRLDQEITTRVRNIANQGSQKMGLELLTYYCSQWQNYHFAVRVLNGTCRYLNRHWVTREKEERGEDRGGDMVYEIHDLGIIHWKEDFYEVRRKQLIEEVLKVVEKGRNNEMTQRSGLTYQIL